MILSSLALPVRAERLPIRIFTTSDGLPSSVILDIFPDSRGFLWFATRNGLSRFDGSEFRNYTTDDGLPHPVINGFLETSEKEYWIATNGGGVCRFNGESRPLFTCHTVGDNFLSNRVNVLYEDRRRRIWLGTDNGLFRMERHNGDWRIEPILVEGLAADVSISTRAVFEDTKGRVWVGLARGLLRIDPDGRAALYAVRGQSVHTVQQIIEHDGALWVALRVGLLAFRPERQPEPSKPVLRTVLNAVRACFQPDGTGLPLPATPGEACLSNAQTGLPGDIVGAFLPAPNGRLWIATNGGLSYLQSGQLTRFPAKQAALAMLNIFELAQDRQGQLWIATAAGAVRVTPAGLVTYDLEDGLGHPRIRTIFERHGSLFAVSGDWVVNRFDGSRFEATTPRIPAGATYGYYSHGVFLDHSNHWWLLTNFGLYRFKVGATLEPLAQHTPEAIDQPRDDLPNDWVRLFEDSRGDIWIATRSRRAFNLRRWDRATETIRTFTDGFGAEHQLPISFAEDRAGVLWVGFEGGGLARYHSDGFTIYGAAHGVPSHLTALHVDASDRLWITSASAGLSMLTGGDDKTLRFDRYTTADGLSTNNIQCIAEDLQGRIYLGTSRGVDRFDPATRHVKHFTASDGLAADYVTAAVRDRSGALWFGTNEGVSRLVPTADTASPPPPIWIGELRVGGTLHPIPELGVTALANLTFEPNQNHVQIAFFSADIGTGRPLRYRYRLDGADTEWTGPTERRVVHYASLSPGRYRFIVEAINADGIASDRPATVSFAVLPPLWRRWWFMCLGATLLTGAAYSLHRFRVVRLLELERVRGRIAADLHDDIGGNLSRIAIQSEVARREVGDQVESPARRLTEIGETARTVVESLSDVVWSVDPRQDDLASVEQRVREYAADVLGAHGVRWTFQGTGHPGRVGLDPEARHDLLLLLKEGITNIARHANATIASLELRLEGARLHAELRDDGCGFDPAVLERDRRARGHGLANMRERARHLGGQLEIETAPGGGTRIRLDMPVSSRRRMIMRLWPARR